MTKFLMRRLLYVIPVLLGVTIVVFLTVKIVPGDPVDVLAGPGASDQTKQELRVHLGLNKSIPVQYWNWLTSALHGDLGTSISKQQPARPLVMDAFNNTLILVVFAIVLSLILGLGLGLLSALRPRGVESKVSSGISAMFISAPQYTVAILFVVYLAARSGWFPVTGMHSRDDGSFIDLLWHAFLPSLTAALVPAGIIARTFRASMRDVMAMDFIEALHARGLSKRRILVHAVHNTAPSLLTVAGLQFGYLLGGIVFVEMIFSWPGLGQLLYQSISSRDLPLIQAGVLVSAVVFVLLNVIVDASHALIDSRVRTS